MSSKTNTRALARWRLVLGSHADQGLGGSGDHLSGMEGYGAMDAHLDFLYGREREARGHRSDQRSGSLGGSQLTVPEWVQGVRELFPQDTVEVLEKQALEKYGLTELITDPEILQGMQPSYELMKTVLSFRHVMTDEVLEIAKELIRRTVEEIKRKLVHEVRRTLWGKVQRYQRSPVKLARNFDWKRTLRDNLKNYDPDRRQIVLDQLHFFSNSQRQLRWDIIVCIDCSGSMMDSVIYSAVMAGIFHGLPTLKTSLVAFDTSVVDLSDRVDDPAAVLLSIQLGGGTMIGKAMRYCHQLIENPHRTIVVLVTDFYEGCSENLLLSEVKAMREEGVRMLGLGALAPDAKPDYDRRLAQRCANQGMEVAALTPNQLAEWLSQIVS